MLTDSQEEQGDVQEEEECNETDVATQGADAARGDQFFYSLLVIKKRESYSRRKVKMVQVVK